jgi:hypothetical protein
MDAGQAGGDFSRCAGVVYFVSEFPEPGEQRPEIVSFHIRGHLRRRGY